MRRLPVRLREDAISNLEEIGRFIVEMSGSNKTALGFVNRIKTKCLKIGDAPRGSILREDLGPGIRLAAFERSAVIAYRVLPDCIEVVNIFYGRRDFETLMRENLN